MILYLFALKRPFSGAAMRRLANIQLTRNFGRRSRLAQFMREANEVSSINCDKKVVGVELVVSHAFLFIHNVSTF